MDDIKTMTADELEARKAEIRAGIDVEGADLDALEAEARAINEELEARKAEAARKAETRQAVAEGAGTIEIDIPKEEERKVYGIETLEYRNAWVKKLINRDMSEEERSALSSAGAVIPTMTVNAVWDKLIKPAELLGRVDVSQFSTYVRFPKATTVNPATNQAIGSEISESSDAIGYVDLVPNEYVKLLTVGADIDHMAIDAVHDWIVENLTGSIRYAMNKDVLIGTNSNAFKGITESVNTSATAIPATVTKASILKIMGSLKAQYQAGAVWIMSTSMFYEEIMTLTALNDYVINNGFQYKLFGHDVILMDEAVISSKENIFYGDPKAYKVNIFKPIEVKAFETATTTNLQFRGATLADGELLDTSAFVRFAKT